MRIEFTKMEGAGNDYVYVNGFSQKIDYEKKPEIVRRLSDRHFGIGGDGVIFINPIEGADCEMEMWNADGTRGEMCGNGIRCVGKYVYDHGIVKQKEISVISYGKTKYLTLYTDETGKVDKVRVNMGAPILEAKEIPVVADKSPVVAEPIEAAGRTWEMTCVSMGNPHAVVFIDDTASFPIAEIGPRFENNPRFPNRTNTEFVQVVDRSHVNMRVWERGTGETLACGTGCCATVVACVLNNKTDSKVWVKVLGGEILCEWDQKENVVWMTGPATWVFDGQVEV